MTDTTSGARPGKGLRTAGIVLMVLAVVLGVGAVIAGFAPLFGDRPVEVREGTSVTAEAGDELALYRIGGQAGEGSCRVVGPDGGDVELRRQLGSETLTLDGVSYVLDRVFVASGDGAHRVSCSSTGYAVGPRIGVFGIVGLVLAGVFGGIGMFIVGVILLVIGATRGRSSGPPSHTGQGQPPFPGQGQGQWGQPPFQGRPPYQGPPQWGQPPQQGPGPPAAGGPGQVQPPFPS